jgi:hypothetical protein
MRDVKTGEVKEFSSISNARGSIGLSPKHKVISRLVNGVTIPRLFKNRYEIKHSDDSREWYFMDEEKISTKYKNIGPFQAKNVETNVVLEAESMVELSRLTGVKPTTIETCVSSLVPRLAKKYLFRIKEDINWPESYTTSQITSPKNMRIVNIQTGEVLFFTSLNKLRKHLGIDKRTLKLRLQLGTHYKGWKIEEVM